MTVRLYLRVSTRAQSETGYSLAAQRVKGEGWAAYQGLSDVQVYEDAGVSGTRDDRPGLTALLLDLRPDDIVVTYALSRLARGGAVQLLGIVRDIREKGARVVFLQESIDTDTSTGRLMLTILAALAELELEQTRERTDMGRTQAAAQGVYPQGARTLPMGWTTDDAGHIVEDPQQAEVVRLIFTQGKASYRSTAEMLKATGLRSERGGEWNPIQVRRVVTFEGYWTGQQIYRAATRPDEPGQHIILPAPVLVSRQEWEAAQRDPAENHQRRRRDLFPLTGHLRCGCGARVSGRSSVKPLPDGSRQPQPQYICHAHVRKTATCPTNGGKTRTYALSWIHGAARRAVAELLLNPTDPAATAAAYGAAPAPDPYMGERRELEEKKDALLSVFLDKVIDRATYDRRRLTLDARLAELSPPVVGPPPLMPARPDLAERALNCSNEDFHDLLGLLRIELRAGAGEVTVTSFRALGEQAQEVRRLRTWPSG